MPERYILRPRDFLRDRVMDSISRSIDFEIPGDTLERILQLTSRCEVPVLVSNHQSHFDAVVLALMADKILSSHRHALKGFYLPYAVSVTTGDQGKNINTFFHLTNDWFEQRRVFPIPVTRNKDAEKYGIKNPNIKSLRDIMRSSKNGFGVAIPPEGSVEGGRKDLTGEIHGMIPPQEGGIELLMQPGVFFVPLSIHGTYRIFDPNSKFPTKEAVLSVLSDTFLSHAKTLATVRVGNPISSDEFPTDGESSATDFLMRQIARNLPPEAQGIYRLHTSEV